MTYRTEHDGLGEMLIPQNALYGIHSARARDNFPVSMRGMDPDFIKNIALIKKAAALLNGKNGALPPEKAEAIVFACDEIIAGRYLDAFIVDAMQGGAGTSANMNANEVIANIAIRSLGGKCGDYSLIHPIDHVNMFQSTNDVIPTAGRLTAIEKCSRFLSVLDVLHAALRDKEKEFDDILKVGRTQLQDAVPMRVGQGYGAYAAMIERSKAQIESAMLCLCSINLGATAIGTAINVERPYYDGIVDTVAGLYGRKLRRADNLFDATQNADDFATVSSAVKVCAIKLSKMASDFRLLSSGPNSGFCEVQLPAKQSGSSIMPGKVNPVLPEALNQAAFLVMGHDVTIAQAVEAGQLELNAFLPIVLFQLFEEIDILSNAVSTFTENCLRGIVINLNECEDDINRCWSIATALNPSIGYDRSTAIVKKAQKSKKSIFEIARKESGLPAEELERLLDPHSLTEIKE
ncbi:MAG: aspartate ammonia-lyase [Oscillospiraceae bacterium]|nr:aspartate ammonia-lyase [Oscillospiraceae bacterium]